MTVPTTVPLPDPCDAVRSEDRAVYRAGAAPESTEAERLDRIARVALGSHELLGLLGVRLDAFGLAAAGGLRGLFDDPGDALRETRPPREDLLRV